jgi:tetratricopeptide (TPR) repeat protein
VLLHEYAHHYIIANIRVAYPAWYNEGVAEFLSTADFVEEGVWIGKFTNVRAAWLFAPTWLNINTLLTANPGELSDEKNAQFYAQSWLAVHYLFRRPERAAGFDKYIQALHEGGDPIRSFEPAFGITPQAFDKELRDYKSKPLQANRVPGFSASLRLDAKVERLPATADDLLMPVSHLRSAPGRKYAGGSLNTIRAQHKKLPGDPFTIRARALGEIWYGDLDEARKLLDNLLVAEPQNAETQHLSGLCHLRMAYAAKDPALFVKARTGFTTAHKIDSTRASSLYRYIECGLNESGGVFGDHYADVMVMTYRLAPQVGPYAYGLANALMQQKRFAEAIKVLRPFAANSHASAKAKGRVGALMDAAKAEKELKIAWASPAADTDDEDET